MQNQLQNFNIANNDLYESDDRIKNELISKVRGQVRQSANGYTILPTYHPAAILRNPNLRPTIEQDFKTLIEIANRLHQKDDTPESKQLPMFS